MVGHVPLDVSSAATTYFLKFESLSLHETNIFLQNSRYSNFACASRKEAYVPWLLLLRLTTHVMSPMLDQSNSAQRIFVFWKDAGTDLETTPVDLQIRRNRTTEMYVTIIQI